MAQHDYNIANQTGANFRADLNNALNAIATNNSGDNEPSTTFAYEWWIDTTNDVLKLRNTSNNAWITMPFSINADNTVDINAGTVNGITSFSFSSGSTVTAILDEDNLSSNSATALATQQSIKAYVDSQVTAQDLDISDGSSTIAIDLDSETLSLLGGTGVTSTASGNGVTFAIGQPVGTSDNVVFNQVTASLVGNASTATALATARTISGVSFDGTANITLDTDDIGEGSSNLYFTNARVDSRFDTRLATKTTDNLTEGSSNKYFTNERVDDQVNALLTAGANISLTYDDAAGTLTIANTNSADITSVVAGDGLTGGGTSGDVTLAVGVDDSSIEINSDALRVKASGVTNAMLAGSIANAKLANSSVTVNSQAISLGGSHTFDTDDIGEGSSNLYYTDTRTNSAIDARVTNTFINNLSGVVADTSTALANARSIAIAGDVVGSASFDGSSDISISATIQANSVALGTDTTGNYVQSITGTANKISVSGSGSESADVTLTLPSDVQIANDLTVAGDLTVNGDLTYLDTTNLKIEDNLFELNANLTGSPVNDSGMLINRGNQNNAIFMWDESSDKFAIGLTTADGTTTGNITLASTSTLVANLEGNVTGTVSSISNHSTSDLSEGTNLYYTDARFDTRLGTKTTDNLTEGSNNLYMTTERVQDIVGGMVTGNTETGITVTYDDSDGTLDFVVGTLNQDTTGNAATATTAGTVTTAAQPNITSLGTLTTLTVDDITINGSTISDSGDLTFDLGGNLLVDVDGGIVRYYDDGTEFAQFKSNSQDVQIISIVQDKDIIFRGNDGGSFFNALTLDMSDAGTAIFNNKVGIGTDSPSYPLTIHSTGDGIKFEVSDTVDANYRIQVSGNDILTGSSTASDLIFQTGNIERARIDTSGNLLVGVQSNAPTTTAGINLGANNKLHATRSGGTSGYFNRLSSDGGIVEFAKDGTTVGSIGTASSIMYIGTGDVGIRTNAISDTIEPFNTSNTNVRDALIDLGSSGARFKDLYLSGTARTNQLRLQDSGSTSSGLFHEKDVTGSGTSTNLSVFAESGKEINFMTNGSVTKAMTIDSSGNVGIGTDSPTQMLTLSNGTFQINGSSSFSSNVEIGRVGGDNNMAFATGGTERLRIDTSGNVGIGTTSPVTSLSLGSGSTGMSFKSSNTSFNSGKIAVIKQSEVGSGNGHLIFETYEGGSGGGEKLRITNAGNVGIGTSSPSSYYSGADNLVVHQSSGEAGMTIATANNTTGALYFADGTTGSQAYQGGIAYSHGAEILNLVSGGATKVTIDSSGKVGIGETSPSKLLHITSNTNYEGMLIKGAGHKQLTIESTQSSKQSLVTFTTASQNMSIGLETDDSFIFHSGTASAERIRITSKGNLQLALGSPLQATADGRATNVSVGESFVTILDFSTVGGTNAGRGFYLVTVVREGASVGTSITLQVGVSTNGLVVIYDTIQANGLSAQASNAQIQVKHLSAGSVICHATAIPMSITGTD